MSPAAFVLILLSVLLHAGWHFISKSRNPSYGYFILFSFSLFLTMLPFALFSGMNPLKLPASVLYPALFGGLFGMLGDVGFSYAYRYSEISVAYPVSRALPVILTTLLTAAFGIGSSLGAVTFAGMAVIFSGCLVMPFGDFRTLRRSGVLNKGIYGILTAACATTAYTVVDSFGIRAIMRAAPDDLPRIVAAGTYSCIRESVAFAALSILTLLRKTERAKLTAGLLKHPQPYCAGALAAFAYLLVLLAMNYVTNVSYVQAFRQLSLPLGMILGFVFLKEKVTMRKIAAILLILGGLLIVSAG